MSNILLSDHDNTGKDETQRDPTNCGATVEMQDTTDSPEIVLMEYESTPPPPTKATGVPLVDFINEALDKLCFGEEAEKPEPESQEEITSMTVESDNEEVTPCCGTRSFLDQIKAFFSFPSAEPLPPLPEVRSQVWDRPCSFLFRGVLQLLREDQPETSLPYLHFHRGLPSYPMSVAQT